MTDTISNEDFEAAMKVITAKDKEIASFASEYVDKLLEAVDPVYKEIEDYRNSLPTQNAGSISSSNRSQLDSLYNTIASLRTQAGYVKNYVNPAQNPGAMYQPAPPIPAA